MKFLTALLFMIMGIYFSQFVFAQNALELMPFNVNRSNPSAKDYADAATSLNLKNYMDGKNKPEESGTPIKKQKCVALADKAGAKVDPKTIGKFSLVDYLPKGAGTGKNFEPNSAPEKMVPGKDFISQKGEINPGKPQECCGKILAGAKCGDPKGKGLEYGGLGGGTTGGNTAK